jgi:hypothetical protein
MNCLWLKLEKETQLLWFFYRQYILESKWFLYAVKNRHFETINKWTIYHRNFFQTSTLQNKHLLSWCNKISLCDLLLVNTYLRKGQSSNQSRWVNKRSCFAIRTRFSIKLWGFCFSFRFIRVTVTLRFRLFLCKWNGSRHLNIINKLSCISLTLPIC